MFSSLLVLLYLFRCRSDGFFQALHPTEDIVLCPLLESLFLYVSHHLESSELLELAITSKSVLLKYSETCIRHL
jgi:hypothetical protein